MTNPETHEFCQWLAQHGYISSETAQKARTSASSSPQEVMRLLVKHSLLSKPPAEVWQAYQQAKASQAGSQVVASLREGHQATAPDVQSSKVVEPSRIQKYGRFKVLRELGAGAMGTVYLGEDETLGREVAIKVIQFGETRESDKKLIRDFIKEAKAMAQVSHGNVVVIYDAGMECGVPYLAMQYVEGAKSLDEAACEAADAEEVLRIFGQLVQGVAALHEKGIVHRDLKPDNAMVEAGTGRVLVMDLGLALVAGQHAGDGFEGTPLYMSPEQALMQQNVTRASDVYALVRILLRMLFCDLVDKFAGLIHPPGKSALVFLADIGSELEASGPPAKIREMMGGKYPEELILIVEKGFQPKPENRYQTAGELHEALLQYFDLIKQQKLLKKEKTRQRARDRERELADQKRYTRNIKVGFGIAVCVLLLVVGLTLWALHQSSKAEAQAVARAKAEQKTAETAQLLVAAKEKEVEVQKLRVEVGRRMFTAQAYIDAAEWDKAEEALADIVEKDPEFIPALWAYAEVLYNRLDHKSIEVYKRIIELVQSPEKKARAQFWVLYNGLDLGALLEEEARAMLPEIEPGMYRDLAESYFSVHQFSTHMKSAQKAEADAKRYEADEDSGKADKARSEAKLYQEQAQSFHEKAVMLINRQNGNHWLVAWLHGFLLMNSEPAVAVAHLTKSINRNPAFPMTWYCRSSMLILPPLNDPISAIRDAERLRVLMPRWPRGHLQRARCYFALAEKNKHSIPFSEAKIADAFEVLEDWQNWDAKADFVEGDVALHRVYFYYKKMCMRGEIGRADLADQAKQAALNELVDLKAVAGEDFEKLGVSNRSQAKQMEAALNR